LERLNESLQTMTTLLDALKRGEMRWTQLVKTGYRSSTPWRVHHLIYWLVEQGAVARPERGIYTLTEEGQALLQALQSLKTAKTFPHD
jgi:predicted transcriptional regulator